MNGRAFVDSAPVMERAWAQRSGLGWIGKNSLLLNREMGSFFFIAEIIIDLPLEYDHAVKDFCGTCTACMDACPTDAIVEPYVVDGSKCISYYTIELKESIPTEVKGKFENWIFGCDICQDVCPWNSFSRPHAEERFNPGDALTGFSKQDWREITDEVFTKVFGKSAVKRTKLEGLRRNIAFVDPDVYRYGSTPQKNKPTDFAVGLSLIDFSFLIFKPPKSTDSKLLHVHSQNWYNTSA